MESTRDSAKSSLHNDLMTSPDPCRHLYLSLWPIRAARVPQARWPLRVGAPPCAHSRAASASRRRRRKTTRLPERKANVRPAAEALLAAHRELGEQGFGLLIFDAYRPWYVTWMFWEGTPKDLRDFVADPASGSRHNRGRRWI